MQNILDIIFAAYEFQDNQDKSLVSNILLGMENNVLIEVLQDKHEQFTFRCIFNLHKMWSRYKMLN